MEASPNFQCRWCNERRGTLWFETTDTFKQSWSLVRCDSCSWLSLTPWPTAEQLALAYSDDYYGAGESKFNPRVESVLNAFRSARARRCARLMPSKGGSALDIGCGNGGFLASLGEQTECQLHGVEMPGKAAERAAKRSGVTLHLGSFDQHRFAPAQFDLITLFHVFEHLPSPQSTLASIAASLKPNGHLVLSVPNIASIQSLMFEGKWLHLDPPRHLHFGRPVQMRAAMAACGLKVVDESHWSLEQNPFGFIQSVLNATSIPQNLLYERLKGNRTYANEHGLWSVFFQKLFSAGCLPVALSLELATTLSRTGATVEYTAVKSG